jgi:hypothetical protein
MLRELIATNMRSAMLKRIAIAITLLSGASSAQAISIQIETVGAMSPRNQAAWWSPIVHRDGAVYVSYLATASPQDNVFVAKRTAPNMWTVRDTGFDAVYDVGHTQTSLAIDGQGYLHLFYGMHNNPIRYAQSNQPLSVTNGFQSVSPSVFSGGAYTYPNTATATNGDVYAIIRDQRSSYSAQQGRLFRFNNSTRAWSELPPFAGQSGTTVYPDHIFADSSGDLHIIWEWAAGGAQGARHYGTYAKYDPDTGKYYRANGVAYSTGPITVSASDIYQGLEGSETFTSGIHGVQSAKMTLDEQGRPMIAYGYSINGTDSGYEHRFARWTGSGWIHNTVTPGPFDIDKSWIAYSNGVLRYYGTLSPSNPLHTGSDDIFLRTSNDFGATWSPPTPITSGKDIQRPVGVTVGNTDYLYLPSISGGQLFFASVNFDPPAGVPGDCDGDGDADGADFIAWQTHFPTANSATLAHGDTDRDGDVDGADFAIWKTSFPASPNPSEILAPEPIASIQIIFGLIVIVAYKFRLVSTCEHTLACECDLQR